MSKKPPRQEPPPRTGWRNGLLQDEHKPLGKWFASRIDARRAVRKACELIRAEREKENAMSNEAQTPDSRFTGEAQEPIAYLHDDPNRYDVIHVAVKKLLHDSHDAAGHLHRPVDKSARYTIPLYAHPTPQQAAPTSEQAGAAIEWEEWRRQLAQKVDDYIQADHDGEGDDEAYADLKKHILKTPFITPETGNSASAGATGGAAFKLGDLVRKTKGSEWQGRIVGTYSTVLTPEGYAVESSAHAGSVQIYPASALQPIDAAIAAQGEET